MPAEPGSEPDRAVHAGDGLAADLDAAARVDRDVHAAVAAHARAHGMRSVAEFVQDAASMSTLFSCGVDYVEGDFLALPSAEMNYEFE